jgi:carboxymethylenebutenolidase
MSQSVREAAIALYDRFTHDGMDRRAFMAELTKIAGSAAAASLLLAGIAADPAAAAIVPADDPRLQTRTIQWELIPGRKMSGRLAGAFNGAAP